VFNYEKVTKREQLSAEGFIDCGPIHQFNKELKKDNTRHLWTKNIEGNLFFLVSTEESGTLKMHNSGYGFTVDNYKKIKALTKNMKYLASVEKLRIIAQENKNIKDFSAVDRCDIVHQKVEAVIMDLLESLGEDEAVELFKNIKKSVGFYYV